MKVIISGDTVITGRNSISIDDRIEERSTASILVVSEFGKHYQRGEQVQILDKYNNKKFAGIIEDVKEQKFDISGRTILHTITCIDKTYKADKRRIAKVYKNIYGGDLVKDIISSKLSEEGVSYNSGEVFGKSAFDGGDFTLTQWGMELRINIACTIQFITIYAYDNGTHTFEVRDTDLKVVYSKDVPLVVGENVIEFNIHITEGTYWFGRSGTIVPIMRSSNTTSSFPYTSECGSVTLIGGWNIENGDRNDYYYYPYNIKLKPSIQQGAKVKEAVFNYVRVSDALNSVAEKMGFWWNIDTNNVLHFVEKRSYIAPFTMSNLDMLKDSITVEVNNSMYRNRQYIRGGQDVTDEQEQIFKGDGVKQSFTLGYPIAEEPKIELSKGGGAWTLQTVGIKGKEKDKAFYWTKSKEVLVQDRKETILTENDRLRVTYKGLFDIIILTYDLGAIAEMKGIEGEGSGVVEDVEDNPSISDRLGGFQEANKKLEKYGVLNPQRVIFTTLRTGLQVGQLLTITELTGYDIHNEEFLIESIQTDFIDGEFYYKVTTVSGASFGSWAKLFYNMATKGQAFIIRENIKEDEILITLETFGKSWLIGDRRNIFKKVVTGATPCSTNLFPPFEEKDRIKYVALYDTSGQEFFRKRVTKQEYMTPKELHTLTLISPFEGIEAEIGYVGWWGGIHATDVKGTGIEIDKQVFSRIKSDIESIDILKIDTQGW